MLREYRESEPTVYDKRIEKRMGNVLKNNLRGSSLGGVKLDMVVMFVSLLIVKFHRCSSISKPWEPRQLCGPFANSFYNYSCVYPISTLHSWYYFYYTLVVFVLSRSTLVAFTSCSVRFHHRILFLRLNAECVHSADIITIVLCVCLSSGHTGFCWLRSQVTFWETNGQQASATRK